MNLTSDKLATISGIGLGVLNSVQTVAGQMKPGASMHQSDYISLGVSLLMMLLGWITNKQGVSVNLQSPIKQTPVAQPPVETPIDPNQA